MTDGATRFSRCGPCPVQIEAGLELHVEVKLHLIILSGVFPSVLSQMHHLVMIGIDLKEKDN